MDDTLVDWVGGIDWEVEGRVEILLPLVEIVLHVLFSCSTDDSWITLPLVGNVSGDTSSLVDLVEVPLGLVIDVWFMLPLIGGVDDNVGEDEDASLVDDLGRAVLRD